MKRIVIVVAVLFVVLAGGLVVAPGFIDWNKYKPQILEQIRNATGYDVAVDGALEMAVLPFPHLAASGVTVSNPSVPGSAPLAKLEKASVQLALVPLFSGEIVVSKIQLLKPAVTLSVAADGTPSWMTPALREMQEKGKGEKTENGPGLGNSIALNEISVKDGLFAYADRKSGREAALENANLILKGESLYGPYNLEGTFEYKKNKTQIRLNSGRLDKLAESIAAQLELSFPDLGASASYSGVLTFKDHLELQGETGLSSRDLGELAALSGKPAPDYLKKKALTAKGILTLTDKELAYRNMTAAFAGLEGSGSVAVKNFQKDAKAPMDVAVDLETAKPFVLDALLPASAGSKDGKKGAGTNAAASALLPETWTLPNDVAGTFSLRSAAVTFRGVTYKDVAVSIDSSEKGYGGQVNLKAPGNTTLDVNSLLAFSSRSKSEATGAVTLSEPILTLNAKMAAEEPLNLAQSFVKNPLSDAMKNVLANALTSEGQFSVTPHAFTIKAAFVKLADTRVNVSGSYLPGKGGGRDLLALALATQGLDADEWMRKMAGPGNAAAVAATEAKPDAASVAKNLALPFDLDFSAEVQGLRFKGRDYANFVAKGKLTGATLSLEKANLASATGDTLAVVGGIKDIGTLSGIDLSMSAGVQDPAQLVQSFGGDASHLPPNMGKAEILADIKGAPDKIAFTTNLKALRGTLQAEGSVGDVLTTPKVSDLTLRLQHPSYVDLARIFNPSFNSGVAIKKNLDVFASMSRKGNIYTFSRLQAEIGPSVIKGDIVVNREGAKPVVTGELDITDLPIDKLMGIQAGGGGGNRGGSAGIQSARGTQDARWSRNAINTEILHKADIALKATAASISYGDWVFKNAGMNLDLRGGNLEIKQLDGGFSGGHVALTGGLKSSDKPREPVSFDGHIVAQDISLEEFVRSFSGERLLKAKGDVSLLADIHTTGLSPAALVFDLNGKGTANGKDIVFEGFDLARLSRALVETSSSFTENFGRILESSMQGGSTRFDTLDGIYTIKEGVIYFDKMDLAGPAADVITRGTVSLPLWTMDLESTVQLKEPADAPPLRAAFKGPIDRPAQTFGQSALQQYFQNQLQGVVLNPLMDSLQKKGILPPGVVPQVAPQPAPEPQQPEPVQLDAIQPAAPDAAEQTAPATQEPAPAAEQQPVTDSKAARRKARQQQQEQEPSPEEEIFGIIQGVIGGQ